MGYSTDFDGELTITPALDDALVAQLNEFCETRHEGHTAATPAGPFSEWNRPYLGPLADTTDINIWCNWDFANVEGQEGTVMRWNGSEKSYSMIEWAQFIVANHLPADASVNGVMYAQGEEPEDRWRIAAEGRVIGRQEPVEVYPALDGGTQVGVSLPDGTVARWSVRLSEEEQDSLTTMLEDVLGTPDTMKA